MRYAAALVRQSGNATSQLAGVDGEWGEIHLGASLVEYPNGSSAHIAHDPKVVRWPKGVQGGEAALFD